MVNEKYYIGVNWQYVKNLNEINEAIKNPNDNWDGLTSASDIISITYDTEHCCYVVFWKAHSLFVKI